jgi:hypothetical protein
MLLLLNNADHTVSFAGISQTQTYGKEKLSAFEEVLLASSYGSSRYAHNLSRGRVSFKAKHLIAVRACET